MLSKILNISLLALLGSTTASASVSRLYVSSYAGTVTTLDLSGSGNSTYQLTLVNTENRCSPNASWLQVDVKHQNLFCLDEGITVGNGTLSSFKMRDIKNGSLTPVQHTVVPNAPVNSALYHGPNGAQLLIVAHYAWALTTWKVNPATAALTPLQSFNFTMPKPGPNAARQAAPHPHQVLIDPSGKYLIVPDLGADLLRVFYIDPETLQVSARPSIPVTPGSGPRHGIFYIPPSHHNATSHQKRHLAHAHYYLVNELSSTLSGFEVAYLPQNGGVNMTSFASVPAFGPSNDPIFSGNAPAEIVIPRHPLADGRAQLLVSNRNATFFKNVTNPDPKNATAIESDTLAAFTIGAEGNEIQFDGLSPAGGSFPRHFSVRGDGAMVAVGLQQSGRVVVLRRDVESGRLGEVVAGFEGLGGVTEVVWG
ncbi:MAG: hypothetical protein Q9219_002655 [cf. Caloplaca sp. 3 TL-2023]